MEQARRARHRDPAPARQFRSPLSRWRQCKTHLLSAAVRCDDRAEQRRADRRHRAVAGRGGSIDSIARAQQSGCAQEGSTEDECPCEVSLTRLALCAPCAAIRRKIPAVNPAGRGGFGKLLEAHGGPGPPCAGGGGALLTRRVLPAGLLLGMALIIASCAAPTGPSGLGAPGSDAHIPPYVRVPYQHFSREAAIQIAYRECRGFGQPVVLPHTELPFDNERVEGLWQRVGDYWWLGLSLGD